ncbi:MAG: COG4315 family predicted lipoprotein [Candidatus Limnocylindrales bacterium]
MIVTPRIHGVLVATLVLLATGCASTGGASTTPPASVAASMAQVTIGLASSAALGQVLVGPNGLTLYIHAGDSPTSSTCSGTCATTWPPLVVSAGEQAELASGLTGTLATLTRSDGSVQVTFDGHPLYAWQGDTAAGDTTGQGIAGFTVATPGGAAPSASAVSGY